MASDPASVRDHRRDVGWQVEDRVVDLGGFEVVEEQESPGVDAVGVFPLRERATIESTRDPLRMAGHTEFRTVPFGLSSAFDS